ncbi:hypothetical protein LZ496_02115 [Sphingomonas sp. NSE70-1]|uniref:PilZ domain-containing protein n=2 Tax=Sphingomonas caseinilyticus TaxID=2908205 RepID=A0ABT0RRN8_9SPHN|nr:hypothetical protein [Sphingomonas caseinilyticus]
MIEARVRCGATWSDACILNMSSRGMLIQAQPTPSRGSYLEIRRGSQVVVARVVWSNAIRCGVRTQDIVSAEQLIRDHARSAKSATPVERRREPRLVATRHDASRFRSRAIEFGTFALLGAGVAIFATSLVGELLATPLEAVRQALG